MNFFRTEGTWIDKYLKTKYKMTHIVLSDDSDPIDFIRKLKGMEDMVYLNGIVEKIDPPCAQLVSATYMP